MDTLTQLDIPGIHVVVNTWELRLLGVAKAALESKPWIPEFVHPLEEDEFEIITSLPDPNFQAA